MSRFDEFERSSRLLGKVIDLKEQLSTALSEKSAYREALERLLKLTEPTATYEQFCEEIKKTRGVLDMQTREIRHLYEDSEGIHLCESSKVGLRNEITLVWTKCEKDVPVNRSFRSDENITCPKCIALALDRGPEESAGREVAREELMAEIHRLEMEWFDNDSLISKSDFLADHLLKTFRVERR